MARINLLPWREEARRDRQRQFLYSLMGTLVLGAILVLLVGLFFDQRISHQESRNQQIQVEIKRLEQRIARIRELENTRNRLLSRKQIIESLQASRSLTVELLDKLAKTIPVGITLSNVRQQGVILTLLGTSQSNARVSAYLQSLDGMDLFVKPELQYVRASQDPDSATETYEFAIRVRLDNTKKASEEAGDTPAGAG
ncbi:MAG: PilN domain-containing protein [Xanthomonadales bacterium]|jgi:type IV pilus assembly protein PilN|nr:PilN domain-containing protein [Xanthomonadales bacterium]MDH3924491.1 PilN domain-containing protein [Xanthomonadales bacterium]MDH3940809.1 PilN domain-containing protein [Xanthomonadales bacterium]